MAATALIIVRHLADLPAARRLADSQPGAQFISLSLECLVALRLEERPVRILWSALGSEAMRELLLKKAGHDYAENFPTDSVWFSWSVALYQFEYELAASLMAARALVADGSSRVFLFARMEHVPFSGAPFLDPFRETLAEECIRLACSEQNIALAEQNTTATVKIPPTAFAPKASWPLRIRSLLSQLWAKRRLERILAQRTPYVLAYGDALDYLSLLEQGERMPQGTEFVLIGSLSPGQLEKVLPKLHGRYLPLQRASSGAGDASLADRERDLLDRYLAALAESLSLQPTHRIFAEQRRFLLGQVEKATAPVNRLARKVEVHPPRAILAIPIGYWVPNYFLRRLGSLAPTIACQHGGFGYVPARSLYRGIDAIAVWGESQGALCRASGTEAVILAEKRHSAEPAPIAPQLPAQLHLLLATSSQSNNTAPFFWDDEEYLAFLQDLIALVESHSNLRLTIRHHPRFDHPGAYPPLLAGKQYCRAAGSDSMQTSIDQADLVLFFGAFSTLLFESARAGRRVALVRAQTTFRYADRIAELGLAPQFESAAALLAFLQQPTADEWSRLAAETTDFVRTYGSMPAGSPDIAKWLEQNTR